MICGANWSDPHHLTFAQPRAKALKTGDQYTVPLCRHHHDELHQSPMSEKTWWSVNGIKPLIWAENEYQRWSNENVTSE